MTAAAKTYAGALYDLARDEKKQEQYMQAMYTLRQLLSESPDLLALLGSRAVSLEQRLQVIETCFASLADRDFLNFIKILCQRNLSGCLPDCIRQFELLYSKEFGISEAKAVSAVPLTREQQEKLCSKLQAVTGKRISLQVAVEPSLLGGIRLELDGRELDGTVRRALDDIADQLHRLTL